MRTQEQLKETVRTQILSTPAETPDTAVCEQAGLLLRRGELVAIPTETVYGLAANALDDEAVQAVFTAKGRPQDNPLIVHVASAAWLERYAAEVPDAARRLIDAFWPGPLTVVLPCAPVLAPSVTAGLGTAGFRCPSHPVAHAVIEAAGVPLAAPSANRSGSPSPTEAAHVLADLDGKIAAVVDAGPCAVGVESTVVSVINGVPRVLRPGGVTPEQIKKVLGVVEIDPAVYAPLPADTAAASPGMKYRHYAPKAKITLVHGSAVAFGAYVRAHARTGDFALCFAGEETRFGLPGVAYGDENDPASQARALFGALRTLDTRGAKRAFARVAGEEGVGLAVYNRLLRAAGFSSVTAEEPAAPVEKAAVSAPRTEQPAPAAAKPVPAVEKTAPKKKAARKPAAKTAVQTAAQAETPKQAQAKPAKQTAARQAAEAQAAAAKATGAAAKPAAARKPAAKKRTTKQKPAQGSR